MTTRQKRGTVPCPASCRRAGTLLSAALLLAGLGPLAVPGASDAVAAPSAALAATHRALGRGVNLGNALEAPREGEWGLILEAGWFDLIADAGFDSVRVPIRWSAHTTPGAPYTIDGTFFERIDWVLEQAARTGLHAIVDMHHDDALMANPRDANRVRFLSMWEQIATRYRDAPDSVVFELLNEPHAAFSDDPALWNRLLADALAVVRRTNPTRAVIVGPVGYNAISRLDDLALPDDPNLIVSVHYYEPFAFTHQGAGWVEPSPPVGTRWYASRTDLAAGVQSWSWDTATTPARGYLGIAFGRQYAGFSPRIDAPVDPTRLRLSLRGRVDLAIGCGTDGGDFTFVDEIAGSGDDWRTDVVDLSSCPPDTTRVVLQNRLSGAAAFELRNARLCARGQGCRWLVSNARQAIRASFATARDWGDDNDRPMHLGEFGAYGAGDFVSRVRWTRDVQRFAREAGLATAYWEFGAGFGVYDPARARWRHSLLRALLP